MADLDPLLKDLSEKKQNFRRNVVNLASELKEVRSRLVSQGGILQKRDFYKKGVVEMKAKGMEEEIMKLQEGVGREGWAAEGINFCF
ncbi:hypothetical protein QJS10_CPA05g00101 [Acorus calamus]|uniref:Uncharacterized protein n=1 Tax=Acorus calamus TaxID=4465 RepID=A0AAV9EW01_ACOCL|nr:hypothetical protein QJS10_CPA05g00101 [Acorus calamus]